MYSYSKTVILLFFSLILSILFDIPILRQVLGFLWLSLIPGYAFLRILNLNELDLLEIIIFSAGSGLAITMLLGLILNNVFPCLGLSRPLSTVFITATLTSVTLLLLLIEWKMKRKNSANIFLNLKIEGAFIPQLIALTAVLILSIIGALYKNVFLLLTMIICVSILMAISVFSERWISPKLLPLVIASCSAALLFHTVLISKHLMGVDIFLEFYVFRQTEAGGAWIPPRSTLGYSLIANLNSILSTTILPTVGTKVLGIEGEAFFKLFYPAIFSIVPLALFKMYRRQFGIKTAFLSTLLYVSLPTAFYGIEPLALCRQIIGILFFILSLMLILDREMVSSKKNALLFLFVSALITSYYSLAYLFLFYIVFFYFAPYAALLLRRKSYRQTFGLATLVLIATMVFAWYIHVASSPLNNLISSLSRIARMFTIDFGKPESRGFVGAVSSLNPFIIRSPVGLIHKILIYTQFLFIGLGTMVLAIKPKMFDVSFEYKQLSLASATLLLLCILVPNFSLTLNPTRFYAIAILFLAPMFTLGGLFLAGLVVNCASNIFHNFKRINEGKLGTCIVTFVLIATFLFQVGFVNRITNDYPYSYPLDLDRKEKTNDLSIKTTTHSLYFMDQEVCSSEWLAKTAGVSLKVYADWNSHYSVLKSYALLEDNRMVDITNHTMPESQTYIYLKYITTQLGLISIPSGYLNHSDALPNLTSFNKIYSNGISNIYFVP